MSDVAQIPPTQKLGEFAKLLNVYRSLRPMRVLEIGVCEGGTLQQWIRNAPHGAHIVAIDLPGARWGKKDSAYPDLWESWARHTTLTIILDDSHKQSTIDQAREYAPFDFVFIDGDHSYQGVRMDWESYKTMVKPGGAIALHDILPHADQRIGVWRLWREIKAVHAVNEFIDDPRQGEMGIGVVWL